MLSKRIEYFEKIAACLLVFLIPTQTAFHFWPSFAFVYGIRVDYLSPTVYLTDMLVIGLMFIWFLTDKKSLFLIFQKNRRLVMIFLILALVNSGFSTSFWVTFIKWLKVSEMIFFAFYIRARKLAIGENFLALTLFVSAVFFSLIGILQVFLGRTTGLFYVFGERSFNTSTPGIALTQINGQDFLRAYSTFPHPNALSGYLGAILLLLFFFNLPKDFRKPYYLGALVIVVAVFLSFSLTGALALIFALFLYSLRKMKKNFLLTVQIFVFSSVFISLLLPLFSNKNILYNRLSKNIIERLELSFLSGRMISSRFLVGEGLNTFIINIPAVNSGSISPWLLQPVHNIFLLVFSETGVLGFSIFLWVVFTLASNFYKSRNYPFLTLFAYILFIGTADHYWLTLQQNLLLLSFLLGFANYNLAPRK